MSIYKGTELLAGVATNTISNSHNLFDFIWRDSIINSMEWLRADTFSWQSGEVYVAAYNHILADYNGGTSTTETVGSYTITYVLADDGHKITTDETTVLNIYNESGVAWYYVLDTINQRFKLPRENPTREELIQIIRAKGNGITLGVTNGTNNAGLGTNSSMEVRTSGNAYGSNIGTALGSWTNVLENLESFGLTTDSTKSGIISSMTDSTSVYKGKKYLYFYVGQYSQSATEQTAGLNSSLFNGKVDTDLTNIDNTNNVASSALNTAGIRTVVETYSNGSDWYRIYSDGWVEQGGLFTNANPFTINLLVAMSDTTYSALITIGENGKNANFSANIGTKTTANFSGWMSYASTTYKSCWEVKGMSA